MAAPSISSLPASLKGLQNYLKTAIEHDKRDPVIAYYCRLYAMQKGMENIKASPEARPYLISMMDYLEKVQEDMKENEAVSNKMVGEAHVENYAYKMFLYADTEDRAARFSKNVVKSFFTAGMLFDVLSTFGKVSEEVENNKKYAKWKAAYLHRCLKSGETPIAGPLPEEGDEGGATAGVGFENIAGPSIPPSHMNLLPSDNSGLFPAAGAHAPPSTPQELPRSDHQVPPSSTYQPSPQRSPQPAPRSAHQPAVDPNADWSPPPNPSGVKLSAEAYQKGIKYCKYATSAMQYEDSATAIENLTKALKLLTTGRDA